MIGLFDGGFRKRSGFTLPELLISVAIFGVMLVMMGPFMSMAFTYREQAKRDEIAMDIKRIAGAIVSYSRTANNARLPAPYAGGALKYAIYNPAGTTAAEIDIAMELRNSGVPIDFINNDSAAVRNARVYQRVAGLTHTLPFYFSTGKSVTLTYDVGSIVQTDCPLTDTCYGAAKPGDSAVMTSANVNTWMPSGADYAGVVFSTLPDQKNMLRMTIGRVNRLADRLSSEFYTRQRISSADSRQNFFPKPTNTGAPNLSGATPTANNGCHDGWYNLSATNVNILAQIGLDPAEYGVTAWGGAIQYCQDYDPTATGTGTANTPPHYAAIRINSSLSSAAAPSGVNDVIITF